MLKRLLLTLLFITAVLNAAPQGNNTPIANAGEDQSDIAIGTTVMLDGSASSTPYGQPPLTYLWSITDMPGGSIAELSSTTDVDPIFTADKGGSYTVSLVVNDARGYSLADSVVVTTIRFTRDEYTEIVTDNVTGLMWQDDSRVSSIYGVWAEALMYCSVDLIGYGGYYDWRLPNIEELEGIVDPDHADPSISPVFQNTNTIHYNYWSSTTYSGNTGSARLVDFYSGYTNNLGKIYDNNMRCVRAGQ